MKRIAFGFGLLALGACNIAAPVGGAGPVSGGGMREQLVLGSNMSFEQCRANGGLIIQDAGSPMVACDPRVKARQPVPADEFAHPTAQPGATAPAASSS